jgi:DNA ligase-1
MIVKPMLSASLDEVDLSSLRYPLLASPKLDGIRCLLINGVAFSRNMKPIRNEFVQAWANDKHGFDGELIVGSSTGPNVLGFTQSGVMSKEGYPDFTFHAFDVFNAPNPFAERYEQLMKIGYMDRFDPVLHAEIRNAQDLSDFEEDCLDLGYEGVMVRDPYGPYKNGRSTLREGFLMKLKRFTDGEAVVVRLEEGRHNANILQADELGRAKRSHSILNLVPNGTVGTLIVSDPKWGELRVAPGTMTHADRCYYWERPQFLVGKTIHWRSFCYGIKDKPRFPRFYGLRDE